MGIMNWFKGISTTKKPTKCPNCGSTEIDYSMSIMSNCFDVIMYSRSAKYKTEFTCQNCGYKENIDE